MQFRLNDTNAYFQYLQKNTQNDELIRTAHDLLNDLKLHGDFETSQIEYRLVQPGEQAELQKIITLAYNSRYADPTARTLVSFGEVSTDDHVQTWVAAHTNADGHTVILGTMRLVRGEIELFKFFTPPDPQTLEAIAPRVPCEIERLAFHPGLDVDRRSPLKGEILQRLAAEVLATVDVEHDWLVCTMAAHVRSFVEKLGYKVRNLDGWQLADNEQVHFMQTYWPRYFYQAQPFEIVVASESQGVPAAIEETARDIRVWQELITHEWNLDVIRNRLAMPETQYPGRPVLLSAEEVKRGRLFDLTDAHVSQKLDGVNIWIDPQHFYSLVPSTHSKLKENLSVSHGPVADYLHDAWARYDALTDKRDYGFYAFYFTRAGELEAVVQFPEVAEFKLALNSSPGQLLQNRDYTSTWLETRLKLARTHVLVAGASVAAATAENLLRDGRIGYLTIGDPKAPNVTNFNRTAYDVLDIGSDEPKAVSFARRIHRQDPTQFIRLATEFNASNISAYLMGTAQVPPVDVAVEAIDHLNSKLAIIEQTGMARVPLVQISDVGSTAQVTFQNADARARGESLVFGLPDAKLQTLLAQDFVQVAARMVGLEYAVRDEIGRYLRGLKNTPFGTAMPQLGSTAYVAAGVASEKIIRYLLDRERGAIFEYRRIAVDKKNNRFQSCHQPSLMERVLALAMSLKNSGKATASTA